MAIDVKKIKDDQHYTVTLSERVELFGMELMPGREYELRGDAVKTIIDKVRDAKAV